MGLSILSSSEKRSSNIRDFCDWNTMMESDKGTTKPPNKINLLVTSSNISTVNSIESTEIKEETSKSLVSHVM